MYHEMTLFGFTIDPVAGRPLIILKDAGGSTSLPVWVGTTEALAIATDLVLGSSQAGRVSGGLIPLLLEKTGLQVTSVGFEGVNDGGFTAVVKLQGENGELQMEVGTCDAIRMALVCKVPLLVADDVVRKAAVDAVEGEEFAAEQNARRFTEFLDNLDPAALGKYPM